MNNISHVFCLFLLFFASCKKPVDPIDPFEYSGEASAFKNGVIWTGSTYGSISNNSIWVTIDSIPYIGVEALTIAKIPLTPGTYPVYYSLEPNDSLVTALFSYVNYDDYWEDYIILEADSSSFMTLESYDTITREVNGKFDLTFIKKHGSNSDYPDTIRFREGIFNTKLID